MRNLDEQIEVRNLFTAILNSTGTAATTYVGSSVDTLNFSDVTAIVMAGNPTGTNAQGTKIAIKWQESASKDGLAGSWSDITDGAITGTFAFPDIALLANTTYLVQDKLYERLDSQERKRYIRPHATISGTAGNTLFSLSVGVLLGRAANSEDIIAAVATGTDLDASPQALFYNTY